MSTQQLLRFDFADRPVRGTAVRLGPQWRAWAQRLGHGPELTSVLGQASVASLLMASHLKFRGRLNLQVQDGAGLALLLSQVDDSLQQRAMLRRASGADDTLDWPSLTAGGRLAVVIDAESAAERYQAVVRAGGASLADDLAAYFDQSEQLPTRFWLAADGAHAAGVMIQQMPGDTRHGAASPAFDTALALGNTVTEAELLGTESAELVHRLFATEGVRALDQRDVTVACRCSRARIAGLILSLGAQDIEQLLEQQGRVEANCDFCGQQYVYSPDEARALFSAESADPPSDAVH